MNEYKNPIKKMWQQANQSIVDGKNVQLPHETGTATPGYTPAAVGLLYIVNPNTAAPAIYISTGTSSPSDWRLIWD
jgi:hypothetical protein